jgi:hypothetical protein
MAARWAAGGAGEKVRAMNPSLLHIAHADAVRVEQTRRNRRGIRSRRRP